MWDRGGMPTPSPATPVPWWHRRLPSTLVLLAVIGALAGSVAVLGARLTDTLPEVGKDQLGEDPWTDPVGLSDVAGFQVAHIPACSAGQVTRIALWNADSEPYWEVSGPPTAMDTFSVGGTPAGFTVDTPYELPPSDEVVRLVVFRKQGGAAGIRYSIADVDGLPENRLVSGTPLTRYTVAGYQTAAVCGDSAASTNGTSTTVTP